MASLFALLLPALAFVAVLLVHGGQGRWPEPFAIPSWPCALQVLAIAGSIGTFAGVLDWRFHRFGGRRIPPAERRAERIAMGLGAPLFVCLLAATESAQPIAWLLPIVALALTMAAAIAYDETRFHRACGGYERCLHRLLVFGNGVAFLAWLHWSCQRGVLDG